MSSKHFGRLWPGWQPVVNVWRRTETGEAPRWQGATTKNIGNICGRSNAVSEDASPVECSQTFTTGCKALLGHFGPKRLRQLADLIDAAIAGMGTYP